MASAAQSMVTATSSYHRKCRVLRECLQAADALAGIDRPTCQWLQRKLAEECFHLMVAGQFKRGKSSVINALLGAAVLPVGVVPLTSIVTVLRHGLERKVRVYFEDGHELEVPPMTSPRS